MMGESVRQPPLEVTYLNLLCAVRLVRQPTAGLVAVIRSMAGPSLGSVKEDLAVPERGADNGDAA